MCRGSTSGAPASNRADARAMAGAQPKTTPDANVTAAANSSTVQFIEMSFSRGSPSGMMRTSEAFVTNSSAIPAAPPNAEKHRLSVRSCRVRRGAGADRLPHRDLAAAVLARASSRLAMFTQPMRRTSPTAPSIRTSDRRTSPTTMSCSGTRRTVHPLRRDNRRDTAARAPRRACRSAPARQSPVRSGASLAIALGILRTRRAADPAAADRRSSWPPRRRRSARRRSAWRAETRRHDADDVIQIGVEPDALSQDVRIAAEVTLPQAVADDHFPVIAGR